MDLYEITTEEIQFSRQDYEDMINTGTNNLIDYIMDDNNRNEPLGLSRHSSSQNNELMETETFDQYETIPDGSNNETNNGLQSFGICDTARKLKLDIDVEEADMKKATLVIESMQLPNTLNYFEHYVEEKRFVMNNLEQVRQKDQELMEINQEILKNTQKMERLDISSSTRSKTKKAIEKLVDRKSKRLDQLKIGEYREIIELCKRKKKENQQQLLRIWEYLGAKKFWHLIGTENVFILQYLKDIVMDITYIL